MAAHLFARFRSIRALVIVMVTATVSISMPAQNLVSGIAGTGTAGYNGDNMVALDAELDTPFSTVPDTAGNLYIADTYNQRVRKVDSSGNITTIAGNGTAGSGSGQLNYPYGLAVAGSGYLYIADAYNNRVLKLNTATLGVEIVAGTGVGAYSGDGNQAVDAELQRPLGIAADSAGNLYIADTYNQRIRKVDTTGKITTVAGTGVVGYNGDGISAVDAELSYPEEVAVDSAGNLYIADTVNARIRKVNAKGTISTVAGNGTAGYNGDNIAATSAELAYPVGLTIDSNGNLYIADSGNQRIRKLDTSGAITTIAGTGKAGYNGDGITAVTAELSSPTGVSLDSSGKIYIADSQNQRVRALSANQNPGLSVSPSESFSFPQEPIGSSSPSQTFTVTNNGAVKLTLGTLSNSNPQIFPVLTDGCSGQTLAPGATCKFSVEFSPAVTGLLPATATVAYSGTVTIPSNATPPTQTVTLSGTSLLQASSTAVYSAVNPEFAGSQVIFTAVVTAAAGTGTPTGTVTWQQSPASGGTPATLGQTPLVNGQAIFETSFAVGSTTITASYSGSQTFAVSSGTLTQVMQPPLASITTVNGSGQAIGAGPAFPQPLIALVLNVFGSAVAGVPVQFSGPGLSFSSGGQVLTDANGHASVIAYANSAGAVTALATVAGLSPATFVLNSNSGGLLAPTGRFYAAGSTAQFNTFALVATNVNQSCGSNHWTQRNSEGANAITVSDPRDASISPQGGDIWIVWNDQAAAEQPGGIVCYYVAVDSVVAMRLYQARGIVSLPATLIGSADANIVPYLGGTAAPLPANIQAIVNGSAINVGLSDIRPEDAKFASNRVLTSYGALMSGRGFTGVGYQGSAATPWLGQPILSAVSQAAANPVDYAFALQDVDPVNGALPVRPYRELPIGAAPVLIIANVSQTGRGHLGDGNYTNISKFSLNKALLGAVSRVRDLSGFASDGDEPLHVWINDPLSGAYNTIEFSIPNSNQFSGDRAQGYGRVTGQEAGVLPTNTACAGKQPCTMESGNPLFHPYGPSLGGSSSRGRVIGTSEMIATVNRNLDSLGYAFWGYSNFAGTSASNLKYLTVDGSDALYSEANPNPDGVGALPQCASVLEYLSHGVRLHRFIVAGHQPGSAGADLSNYALWRLCSGKRFRGFSLPLFPGSNHRWSRLFAEQWSFARYSGNRGRHGWNRTHRAVGARLHYR
jgi:sugar lactone lactonase YvrE